MKTAEQIRTKPALENLKLEECHEIGVFNASYFISADDCSPYRHSDEDRIVVCRFPTGCGEYSEQKPIAEHVLNAIQSHDALLDALKRCESCLATARQYFPKSIKHQDKFGLELACAEIAKVIALAEKGSK